MSGFTYVTNSLHNDIDPTKSVNVDVPIHKRDGTKIDLLDAFKKRDFDLPILGHLSHHGYALSIDNKKLVWKRERTLIPYVYDEEPRGSMTRRRDGRGPARLNSICVA